MRIHLVLGHINVDYNRTVRFAHVPRRSSFVGERVPR